MTLSLDEKLCDSVVDSVTLSVALLELDRVIVNVLDVVEVIVAEAVELRLDVIVRDWLLVRVDVFDDDAVNVQDDVTVLVRDNV